MFSESVSEIYTNSEAQVLYYIFLEKIKGKYSFELKRRIEEKADDQIISKFQNFINLLISGKPYQYILGETEFFGKNFSVNENVLIPRPETEELLELAIQKIKENFTEKIDFKILEIGTGSGIIPIILKEKFPDSKVISVDISDKALEVARKNAKFHKVEIDFRKLDFLAEKLNENFDIIISNPPYISISEFDEIENSVKNQEPRNALFSPTNDALIFYRKIADFAKENLNENGLIFLEINQKLGKETLELYNDFSEKSLVKDISENDRIVWVRK